MYAHPHIALHVIPYEYSGNYVQQFKMGYVFQKKNINKGKQKQNKQYTPATCHIGFNKHSNGISSMKNPPHVGFGQM